MKIRLWFVATLSAALIATSVLVWLAFRESDQAARSPGRESTSPGDSRRVLPRLLTYRGLTFTDAGGGGTLIEAEGCTFFESVLEGTGRRFRRLIAWPHGSRVSHDDTGRFVIEYRNQGIIGREGELLRTNAAYASAHSLIDGELIQKRIPPNCDAIRDGELVLVGSHIERPSETIELRRPWRR